MLRERPCAWSSCITCVAGTKARQHIQLLDKYRASERESEMQIGKSSESEKRARRRMQTYVCWLYACVCVAAQCCGIDSIVRVLESYARLLPRAHVDLKYRGRQSRSLCNNVYVYVYARMCLPNDAAATATAVASAAIFNGTPLGPIYGTEAANVQRKADLLLLMLPYAYKTASNHPGLFSFWLSGNRSQNLSKISY